MNRNYFPVVLLLSFNLLAKEDTPDTLLKEATKELAQKEDTVITEKNEKIEVPIRPINEIIEELSQSIDQSLRDGFVELMEKTQQGLNQVHTELQVVGGKIKDRITTAKNRLIEEQDKLILEFTLPKDFIFDAADVDVINQNIFSALLKDEKYMIAINGSIGRHRLRGHIRISLKKEINKGTAKSVRESMFDHRVLIGKTNLDDLVVEYDKTKHLLIFTIPKSLKTEAKHSIKVKVK